MDDFDRNVARRVLLEFRGEAQVDDPPDPVLHERLPTGLRQPADAVGAYKRTGTRLAAVLDRVPAEVAHVEAPLPLQPSFHALRLRP